MINHHYRRSFNNTALVEGVLLLQGGLQIPDPDLNYDVAWSEAWLDRTYFSV
jgi:hypothetical protein